MCIVSYEELTGEHSAEHLRRVMSSVGVREDAQLIINPTTIKQTLRPVEEGIANLEDLKFAFRYTQHAADFSSEGTKVSHQVLNLQISNISLTPGS